MSRGRGELPHITGCNGRLAGGLFTLLLVAAMPVNGASPRPWPSPLDGPGQPQLKKSERRPIEKALKQLDKGRPDAAVKAARKAGSTAAARLLQVQIELTRGSADQLAPLQHLVTEQPGYAAAWATLSVVAEAEGDEETALSSARRLVEIWPRSSWAARADQLYERWVEDRAANAANLLAADGAEGCLVELASALALDPAYRPGLMLQARALYALGRLDEAESVLGGLGEEIDALILLAKIAERRGDWLAAMDRYGVLPEDTPGRGAALRRAQIKWRLSVLPAHVQSALASPRISRVELASLAVALVPELEAIGGGRVPLLSDIVDLPSQREIVTVVRLELMEVDRLEHRFYPSREVTAEELSTAVDRLADLVGVAPPEWCDPLHVLSSCVELSVPIRGEAVAELIMGLVHGEVE